MMKQQLLSILCPSYNHEKYVKYFLDSLLAQTNPNWELIIVDDCSTDNNVAEIKKYKDSRIKLIQNPFNMGINCGLNRAFEVSSGQYICFCASDDMLCPDYIDNVFDCFEKHPDKELLYCNLQLMDNDNNLLNQIWYSPKSDRYDILKYMFMKGNWPLSPGMVIKRDLFKQIMPLDIPMSQYQDYKMHIDLMLNADFVVMDKICVLYRKANNQSGLSASNDKTARAKQLEENLLMNSFLKIKDTKTLRNIFKNDLDAYKTIKPETIPFVLGQMALKSSNKYKQIWGYNQIVACINDIKHYETVNKLYGFSYKDFLNLAKYFDKDDTEIKYKKYKGLFNKMLVVIAVLVITIIIIGIAHV